MENIYSEIEEEDLGNSQVFRDAEKSWENVIEAKIE